MLDLLNLLLVEMRTVSGNLWRFGNGPQSAEENRWGRSPFPSLLEWVHGQQVVLHDLAIFSRSRFMLTREYKILVPLG